MARRSGPDTYGPAEAGRVLRLSEKRVRQLADDGRLEVVARNPMRITQASVHRLLKERRANPPTTAPAGRRSAAVDVEVIVTRTLDVALPRMLEAAGAAQLRTEAALRDALATERARAEAAEAELRALRATLAGRRRFRKVKPPEVLPALL